MSRMSVVSFSIDVGTWCGRGAFDLRKAVGNRSDNHPQGGHCWLTCEGLLDGDSVRSVYMMGE